MHSHYCHDSVTVCKDCGISLKMVHALQNADIYTWAHALDAYDDKSIHGEKGIGAGTVSTILAMNIAAI